jgi:glutamyl-tRNA synthetase
MIDSIKNSNRSSGGLIRIAPTPSGYLHLGNILNFRLARSIADELGLRVLLRIDDLDAPRVRREYVEHIFRALEHAGIGWDEGPGTVEDVERVWSQRHRVPLYEECLRSLREKNVLYGCTCSRNRAANGDGACTCTLRTEEDLLGNGAAWRIRTGSPAVSFMSVNGDVESHLLDASMRDFIVRRKDGIPAYQLASAADDAHFGVTHIVRGEDLLPSTCAQIFLSNVEASLSSFRNIRFFHHPLMTAPDGSKLSKSRRAMPVTEQFPDGNSLRDILARLEGPVLKKLFSAGR